MVDLCRSRVLITAEAELDMQHNGIRALEFYSGIGGLRLAFEQSSIRGEVVRAFDWDQTACQVYAANHGHSIVQKVDISTLCVSDLGQDAVDLWLLSPACQPYTVLNPLTKGAADPRAKSFLHLMENVLPELVARRQHPRYILVENVAGFETSDTRQLLLKRLKGQGYNTLELLLTPLQFGIPNSRLRYYLLAKMSPLPFPESGGGKLWRHIPGKGSDWVDPRSAPLERVETNVDDLRRYLDEDAWKDDGHPYAIPHKVLKKWGRLFDIVLPTSQRTCCFTRDWRRSFIRRHPDHENIQHVLASPGRWQARFGGGRDFASASSPTDSFIFPEGISTKSQYRLIGNSVNLPQARRRTFIVRPQLRSTPPTPRHQSSVRAEDSCFDPQSLSQKFSVSCIPTYFSARMASGFVNVRRDVDDKFYRYRMPILLTKIEGKGNGIKTVIPNMSDVARALSRPPTYPTKFFGSELGAQTTVDEKNDRYIVNGAHDATRLRELLDAFIDKFVLCGSCKNPETDLILTKNEMIMRDCKACGERTGVDMRHRLTTYIIKNPPKKKGKGKKGEHAEAPSPSGAEVTGGENGRAEGDDDGVGTDDELTKRIKAEAADLNHDATLAYEDWSADTSPDAVKARVTALQGSVAGMAISAGDEDSDEDADSPYSQLGRWIEENREASAVEVYKKVQELGIEKKHKAVQVLAQALFSENMVAEIPNYNAVFVKMVTSEKHQKALLGGVERLAGTVHPELIPAIPKILMAFYQADVLDEEVIKQWGTHVSKKYVDKETSKKVRKASEPFLRWLDEAEDDDDSD
ncbi:hypothetical protein EW146_g3573 [Bondarzewia mesenterica]|uniref:W2 domain-containing protein n=1 Tax=Bondarzewia mesenterica TaxID=1095465 RepID=A0A4S4LZ01_9AGAM|nr:hypothetical protein EW146_g3573 [Bondarzewia mesenterica]